MSEESNILWKTNSGGIGVDDQHAIWWQKKKSALEGNLLARCEYNLLSRISFAYQWM